VETPARERLGALKCLLEHPENPGAISLRIARRPMANTSTPKTFEAALAELETIVATMESGQLPLAEALAAYQRGAELLQYCQSALKEAEQQVQILERGVLKSFTPADAEKSAGQPSGPEPGDAS
jgi:exodeoxyribonuclease VII small subunit